MVTIIICEKPDAMLHIAKALTEKNLKKKTSSFGVDYYEFEKGKNKFLAVPAVGHLFNLKQKGKGWGYPIFDVEWVPSYKAVKKSAFSEKYFKTLEEVAQKNKGADLISAADFDNEGSLIAWNIIRFMFNDKDAKRMKFSTLTKTDLQKSYEEIMPHLDWQNIESGEVRHYLDFFYGINSSRALTSAIKKASSRFSLLTTGRVQGPILSILAEREAEIKKFVPTPYWQIQAKLLIDKQEIIADYEKDKLWEKPEAEKVKRESDVSKAAVEDVVKKQYRQSPPTPFNVTSLQTEAYRFFGYSPQQTMQIAQRLYSSAYLSYPRTSSEKLPPSINYKGMLQSLVQIKRYAPLAKALLALSSLKPNEGKNTDAAHEAIHTTEEVPNLEKLRTQERNIYDLVARRILATFAGEALRESMQIKMKIGKHIFSTTGRRTLEKGWMQYYGPYAKAEEIILPDLKKGDSAKVSKVDMLSKETAPPPRYSQAAMIKELDKRNLGTRATRAGILQTLYDRHYVSDKSIKVTDLGMAVASTLKKYVPDLIDEKLTREFEKDLEKLHTGKVKKEKIFGEAKRALTKISAEFKEHEEKIGKDLGKAIVIEQEDRSTLGPCKVCGGNMKALFSIFTKKSFAGCSNYSKCKICGFTKKACKCKCPVCGGEKGKCKDVWKEKVWMPTCSVGFPLPGQASYQRLDKICDKCGTPMIRVLRQGKRPFNMCLDPQCETKKDWNKPGEKKKFSKKAKKSKDSKAPKYKNKS